MEKSKQIAIFFLGMVYFMLLTATFLPHHHHEETACYTSTHCEEGVSDYEQYAEEPVNHHHEHNSPEESKHCLTLEYYVFSDAGKNLKRTFDFKIEVTGHHHFLVSVLDNDEDEQLFDAIFKQSGLLPAHNIYTTGIKHELPMRAPPAGLA
jgi:hypothetical protein